MSQAQGTGGFPGSLPFAALYLLKAVDQWPIYSFESPTNLISQARTLNARVGIWRVTSIEVEQLVIQQELIRETLVPYGAAVTE